MRLKHLHYGWRMVIMSACITAIQALAMYTFGVFLKPLTAEFNWERGALSGALSVSILLFGLFSILSGRLSDKYGPRILVTVGGLLVGIGFLLMSRISSLWQVYLIWGLFMGIGSSCCFVPIASTIPRWFTKKRGIAIGITGAGVGLGGIISPLLAQWLISTYHWRQSYLILGLITFIVVIPLAQFMKHSPQRVGLKPYGEDETIKDEHSLITGGTGGLSITQAIKTSRFWVWGLVLSGFFFSSQATKVHIVPHAIDIGISPIIAASIVSIIAGCSVIGQLSVGSISDRIGGRLLLIAGLFLATLALLWLLFAREIWMLYVFAVMLGLAFGGIVVLQIVITSELFGLSSLGMILGGLTLFVTIGEALGAPLAGSIFDITGSYSLAFLISVIISALAIILSLMLLKTKAWRSGAFWLLCGALTDDDVDKALEYADRVMAKL